MSNLYRRRADGTLATPASVAEETLAAARDNADEFVQDACLDAIMSLRCGLPPSPAAWAIVAAFFDATNDV